MTYVDLQQRLHDHPFKPFRIRMVNSTSYEIREPWMIMVGESSAIIAAQTRKDDRGFDLVTDWKRVLIDQMMEFGDIESKRNGSQKRGR